MSIYIGDKEIKNLFVGESISISDMQGPCPDGFHIPTYDEVIALRTLGYNIGAWEQYGSGTNLYRYLKTFGSGSGYTPNEIQGTNAVWGPISTTMYRTSTFDGTSHYYWYCDEDYMSASGGYTNDGFFIRPFKNSPVTPDSNWTVLYQGTGSAGIYHNSTLGLISIGNGTTWITIADKNLGATTVYNYGDTFSQANCGNCYQRGNNHGFPYNNTISSTTTKVNATNYGPGNYYSSNVYVKGGSKTYWDTSKNQNLRGGVSQGTTEKGAAKAVYLGENKVRPIQKYKTYTVVWNEVSTPTNFFVRYEDDAAGMTQGSTDFDEFFGYSAVLLDANGDEVEEVTQSQSGGNGKLDMSKFTKALTGTANNVMIKFPRRGIKMSKSGTQVTLSITDEPDKDGFQYYAFTKGTTIKDYLYLGAYLGSFTTNNSSVSSYSSGNTWLKSWATKSRTNLSSPASSQSRGNFITTASKNGNGFDITSLYSRWFINSLFMLKWCNPYSENIIGSGATSSTTVAPGLTNSITTATGAITSPSRIKMFGLEDWRGNLSEFLNYCYFVSGKLYASLNHSSTNTNLGAASSGYMRSIDGTNDTMFKNTSSSAGTKTTYYTSYVSSSSNSSTRYIFAGSGGLSSGNGALGSAVLSDGTSYGSEGVGARLMYL